MFYSPTARDPGWGANQAGSPVEQVKDDAIALTTSFILLRFPDLWEIVGSWSAPGPLALDCDLPVYQPLGQV